ncbi:MAG: hypothetical protein ABR575_08725 [Actinomycetota bacterium]
MDSERPHEPGEVGPSYDVPAEAVAAAMLECFSRWGINPLTAVFVPPIAEASKDRVPVGFLTDP